MPVKEQNHDSCAKEAMKLIERAGYAIYVLKCMANDECPYVPGPGEFKKLEEEIDTIRRRIRAMR